MFLKKKIATVTLHLFYHKNNIVKRFTYPLNELSENES